MLHQIRMILFLGLFVCCCADLGEKRPLPIATSPYRSFGANDTSYIRLFPDWNAMTTGYSFSHPTDIAIGNDGYILVADKGNDKIVVMDKSGVIQNHSRLNKIAPIESPLGIDIDSKLNLFIVNGTNTIYCWNQYLNYAAIDSVVLQYVLRDTVTGERFSYSYAETENAMSDTTRHLVFEKFIYSGEQSLIDSLQNIYAFYTDSKLDAQFMGVAAGPFGKSFLYVTDKKRNRILKIDVVRNGMALLKNRWVTFTYSGKFNQTIASYGSGAGTVDTPHAIATDDKGDIYFTQTGGNFLVQKLSYKDFNSVFNLNEHPIMDLRSPPLFVSPADIAVDRQSNIYVIEKEPYLIIKTNPDSSIDTTYSYFHKFTADGKIIDLRDKGIMTAIFQQPQGIAVDEEDIIYIVNTGKNQIERFKLSISEEDLPRVP